MKRGAVKKRSGSKLVNVWINDALLDVLDDGVRVTDLDRAKFIRHAVREKAARHGVKLPLELEAA